MWSARLGAGADSLDIPLGGIFRGVRLPETSSEHDLYETAALWWNRPRDIPALVDTATYDAEVVRPSADHSGEPFAQPV